MADMMELNDRVEHVTANGRRIRVRLETTTSGDVLIRYQDGAGTFTTALRTTPADARRLAHALLLFTEGGGSS